MRQNFENKLLGESWSPGHSRMLRKALRLFLAELPVPTVGSRNKPTSLTTVVQTPKQYQLYMEYTLKEIC